MLVVRNAEGEVLLEQLRTTHARAARRQPGSAVSSDGLAEQLAALGYTEGDPSIDFPLQLAGLEDPKDTPGVPARLGRIVERARSMPPEAGVAVLRDALVAFPTARLLQSTLIRGLVASGDLDAAREAARDLGVPAASIDHELAGILLELGRTDEVLAVLGPRWDADVERAELAAEALRRTGRCPEAETLLDEVKAKGPLGHAVRGACAVSRGELIEAVPHLESAVAGGLVEMEPVLGGALLYTGRVERALRVLRRVHAREPDERSVELLGLALSTSGRDAEAVAVFAAGEAAGLDLSWRALAAWAECERSTDPNRVIRCDRLAQVRRAGAPPDVLAVLEEGMACPGASEDH